MCVTCGFMPAKESMSVSNAPIFSPYPTFPHDQNKVLRSTTCTIQHCGICSRCVLHCQPYLRQPPSAPAYPSTISSPISFGQFDQTFDLGIYQRTTRCLCACPEAAHRLNNSGFNAKMYHTAVLGLSPDPKLAGILPQGKEVRVGTPARSNLCGFPAQISSFSSWDSPDRGRFRAEM
jgi:hypothetical protein